MIPTNKPRRVGLPVLVVGLCLLLATPFFLRSPIRPAIDSSTDTPPRDEQQQQQRQQIPPPHMATRSSVKPSATAAVEASSTQLQQIPSTPAKRKCINAGFSAKLQTKFSKLGHCRKLEKVCWSSGTIVVAAEKLETTKNALSGGGFHPYIYPMSDSRLESIVKGFPNHLKGLPTIPARPFTAFEDNPALQSPIWHNCSIPVIIYPHYLFNFGHTMQRVGAWLHAALSSISAAAAAAATTTTTASGGSRSGQIDISAGLKDQFQFVIMTPDGLGLPSFMGHLLQPFTNNPIQSFQAASSDKRPEVPACFEKVLVCFGNDVINLTQYGQFLANHYSNTDNTLEPLLKLDLEETKKLKEESWKVANNKETVSQRTAAINRRQPQATSGVSSNGSGSGSKKGKTGNAALNVVFDARGGSDRQLQNLADLLKACSTSTINSLALNCRATNFTDIKSAALDLQTVDVLIGMHGAGLVNGFLLPSNTAVIEIIPLGMKRMVPYAERNAADTASQLSWWHLYVCDDEITVLGEHEKRGQKPAWTWPLYRGATVSWSSIELVLKSAIAVKDDHKQYMEVYKRNGHSFFLMKGGETRQAGLEERRDQCPAGSDPAPNSGPHINYLSGLYTIYEVPPYPRGIALLLNGCSRNSTEWWKPFFPGCPDCKGYLEHVAIKDAALNSHLAVIAMYPNKKEYPEFQGWKADESGVQRPVSGPDCWDDRQDPTTSVDAPRMKAALDYVIAAEGLESLPVYVVGFSSGARMAWMLPSVMNVRGIYPIGIHMAPHWLEGWLRLTGNAYPPTAVMQMVDDPRVRDTLQTNIQMLKKVGVPVALVNIRQTAASIDIFKKWLGIDDKTAKALMTRLKKLDFLDENNMYSRVKQPIVKEVIALTEAIAADFSLDVGTLTELEFWLLGVHYIYSDHAEKIISWLMDGGVTKFTTT